MRRRTIIYGPLLLLCFTINNIIPANAQIWELKWSDEFDVNGLPDNTKWGYDVGGGGWGNNELQYYTQSKTENARVEGGNLIIEARKESYGGRNYTSARLLSKNSGDWKYGKIEIKAKIPGGRGSWPAIWMLPTDWVYGNWPASGEIDIMEYVGYDPKIIHGSIHTDAYNHVLGTQKSDTTVLADAETNYHIYSIEWTDKKIDFYVDNRNYFSFYNMGSWQKWPFDQKFHLMLNVAVGGNWGGVQGVDDNIFPIKMMIDYVRVYQDKTLSFSKIERYEDCKIFPNPAKNRIKITASTAFSKVEIYSIIGAKVYDNNSDAVKSSELDISTICPGTYTLVIKNNKGEIKGRQKLVKKG